MGSRESYDPRQRPWYAGARNASGVVWSEPYQYVSNGEPAVAAARAIRGTDGEEVLGVVSATVGLESISLFLASMEELSGGGAVAVVDRMGRALVSLRDGTDPAPAALSRVGELPAPLGELFGNYATLSELVVHAATSDGKRWR
jgi:hypothetical protein